MLLSLSESGDPLHGDSGLSDFQQEISNFTQSEISLDFTDKREDIFAERKFKAWKGLNKEIARCDFMAGRAALSLRQGGFRAITLWRRSEKGMSLMQIKESDKMIPFFVEHMAGFIASVLGDCIDPRQFAIVAPPKRRHKVRNFACECARGIAERLGIQYHDDFATCSSKHRVNAIFEAEFVPQQHNIIVFDDFVTTGSTLISMKRLLDSLGKNSIHFAAVLNKK